MRWVVPETMHVTLKFCGERQNDTVELLKKNLSMIVPRGPFNIGAEGVGGFPSLLKARIIWTAINGDIPELKVLQKTVERAAAHSGILPETRPYSPHLTLGRRSSYWAIDEDTLSDINGAALSVDPWQVDEIILMRSELHHTGPVYTKLGVFKI